MKNIVKFFARANYYYSILWIACTGTDKFQYREKSLVHRALVWVPCQLTLMQKGMSKACLH